MYRSLSCSACDHAKIPSALDLHSAWENQLPYEAVVEQIHNDSFIGSEREAWRVNGALP